MARFAAVLKQAWQEASATSTYGATHCVPRFDPVHPGTQVGVEGREGDGCNGGMGGAGRWLVAREVTTWQKLSPGTWLRCPESEGIPADHGAAAQRPDWLVPTPAWPTTVWATAIAAAGLLGRIVSPACHVLHYHPDPHSAWNTTQPSSIQAAALTEHIVNQDPGEASNVGDGVLVCCQPLPALEAPADRGGESSASQLAQSRRGVVCKAAAAQG